MCASCPAFLAYRYIGRLLANADCRIRGEACGCCAGVGGGKLFCLSDALQIDGGKAMDTTVLSTAPAVMATTLFSCFSWCKALAPVTQERVWQLTRCVHVPVNRACNCLRPVVLWAHAALCCTHRPAGPPASHACDTSDTASLAFVVGILLLRGQRRACVHPSM